MKLRKKYFLNIVLKHQVRDEFIMDKAKNWIHFPITVQEINNAKVMWQTRFNLLTVIGAFDCVHVEIKKKKHQCLEMEYINCKGYATIHFQATCDTEERITSISTQWPSSVHDSRICRIHVRDIISQYDGTACCLIGDFGYSISP
ncbi:hypothetical protein J6590_108765 [Homalodisca vitripennis]|nr:hypothetical protein J6590_108765 [Homalodisca vitripennis]